MGTRGVVGEVSVLSAGGERRLPDGGIRAVDPFRDLEDVVDLIGLAFGDRLDPAGRATLGRMRRFARSGPLMQWLWAFLGKAAMAPGLVWVIGGEIVGNVSLRRSRSGSGYLIGNVVVHPDYQGRGVGGALMRRAMKVVSQRGVPWVGLEVRADNAVARTMYEGLSFQEVGRTHHLIREPGGGHVEKPDAEGAVRRAGRQDAGALIRLMERVIPAEQRPLLEKTPDDYRPSWARRIDHWLRCEDEIWWVVQEGEEIRGAVRAVRKMGGLPHRLEILVRPSAADLASALVRRGLAKLAGSNRAITSAVPSPAQPALTALSAEGFHEVRVLIQMKRRLKHETSAEKAA